MVAIGHKFSFPIDFSTGKHAELYSAPRVVESYSIQLATRLLSWRAIAKLLVREQPCWHRELVNLRRPDPRIYNVGDIVFARRAIHSDLKHGRVDKLMHPFTGPWRIVRLLSGASYELEFATDPKHCNKKHASDLLPYPPELIPFEPVNGPNNRYSQLYKPVGKMPYKEAGIEGFTPPQPFAIPAHFARQGNFRDFHFPTLAKLNDEFDPFPWRNDNERIYYLSNDVVEEAPTMYHGPLLSPAALRAPSIPPISSLVTSITDSVDRLFFISHSLGNPSIREWCLVRVAFAGSTALLPLCLQDGCFLVKFFTLHHEDM
jgi:hypothetical protein